MKFTAGKIVDIYAALNSISFKCRLEYKHARKVNDLKKLFKNRAEIILEMEKNMIDKNGGVVNADGGVKFENQEKAKAFIEERAKMFNEEDELEFDKLNLSKYSDNVEIDINFIEALDEVIIFEEGVQNE